MDKTSTKKKQTKSDTTGTKMKKKSTSTDYSIYADKIRKIFPMYSSPEYDELKKLDSRTLRKNYTYLCDDDGEEPVLLWKQNNRGGRRVEPSKVTMQCISLFYKDVKLDKSDKELSCNDKIYTPDGQRVDPRLMKRKLENRNKSKNQREGKSNNTNLPKVDIQFSYMAKEHIEEISKRFKTNHSEFLSSDNIESRILENIYQGLKMTDISKVYHNAGPGGPARILSYPIKAEEDEEDDNSDHASSNESKKDKKKKEGSKTPSSKLSKRKDRGEDTEDTHNEDSKVQKVDKDESLASINIGMDKYYPSFKSKWLIILELLKRNITKVQPYNSKELRDILTSDNGEVKFIECLDKLVTPAYDLKFNLLVTLGENIWNCTFRKCETELSFWEVCKFGKEPDKRGTFPTQVYYKVRCKSNNQLVDKILSLYKPTKCSQDLKVTKGSNGVMMVDGEEFTKSMYVRLMVTLFDVNFHDFSS